MWTGDFNPFTLTPITDRFGLVSPIFLYYSASLCWLPCSLFNSSFKNVTPFPPTHPLLDMPAGRAGRALAGSPQTRAHAQTHTTTPAPDLSISTRSVSTAGALAFGISSLGMGLLWGWEVLVLRFHVSQLTACPKLIHTSMSVSSWEEPLCQFRVNTGVVRKATPSVGKCWSFSLQHSPCCSLLPVTALGFTKAHCCLF